MLRADRVHVHGAVGETLVASGRAEAQPEVAAYHLGAAGRADRGGAAVEAGLAHGTPERPLPGGGGPRARGARAGATSCPRTSGTQTELKSRSRLVMCLTAVDQSAPEALEESRRVEELARRLG